VDASQAQPNPAEVVLAVPEIRDYRAINGELVRHLDQGCRAIRLTGAGGQRLLASGLTGSWAGVIEVAGDAGPELAAEMDAPNLTLVCRGSVGDGGASRLIAGRVLIVGRAGVAFGYAQRGGLAMVAGTTGARAGLRQRGGDLILIGRAGPLCGESQSGGRLLTCAELGLHAGRGHRGGRFIRIDQTGSFDDADDRAAWESAFHAFRPWLGAESYRVSAP
jgi:methylamine---glutamate N-methyltransferase subunit B